MKRQLCFVAMAVLFAQTSASAQLITYVDATGGDDGNTALAAGGVLTPTTTPAGGANGDDNWSVRTFGEGDSVLTSNDGGAGDAAEDAPGLATTITGLLPSTPYNVFGYFWSDSNNWRLKASLTEMPPLGDDLAVSFSRTGSETSTAGTTALLADFATPLMTEDAANLLVTEGNRTMYQAALGQTNSDANGEIVVFIDDLANPTVSGSQRTWYDGVGYSLVPEPASLSLVGVGMLGLLLCRRRTVARQKRASAHGAVRAGR